MKLNERVDTLITTLPQLQLLSSRMRKLEEFAYDVETNTLKVRGANKNFKLVGISISWGTYDNYYIPVGHVFDEDQLDLDVVVSYLKPIFEREDVRIIGHNLAFDMHSLARVGIYIKTKDLFDTQVASWICNENTRNGLKDNTSEILGVHQSKIDEVFNTVTKEEKKEMGLKSNQKPTFDLTRIKYATKYAIDDSYYTWNLYLYFLDKLEEEEMSSIYFKVYVPFIRTLYNMESRGVSVDLELAERMRLEMESDKEELLYKAYELAGVEFKLGSNQQIAELLFGYDEAKNPNQEIIDMSFNFPVVSVTPKGVPQASTAVLVELAKQEYKVKRKQEGVELVKILLEYKKIAKLVTFLEFDKKDLLYDDSKLHPSFNINGTTSGRISCSNPNLQQLPNSLEDDSSGLYELVKKYEIRRVFIPSKCNKTGKQLKMIASDYANLEMKILTHFSKDKLLLDMFENGYDSHGSTAVNMFDLECEPNECKKLYPELRTVGKVLNFLKPSA